MKLPPLLSFLLCVSACHAASIQVGFDAAPDLDAFTYNVSTSDPDGVATGPSFTANQGLLGGGGALFSDALRDHYMIYNDAFSLDPGGIYTVSAHFLNRGYVGIGFSQSLVHPLLDFQPDNSVMLSAGDETTMNVSNYYSGNQVWNNNDVLPNTIGSPADASAGDWLYFRLTLTNTGGSAFDVDYSIHLSDSSGAILAPMLDGSYAIADSGFSTGLHPFFFYQSGGGDTVIDNFNVSAIPEPSGAMATLGLLAAGTLIRRRARRVA